MLPVDSRITPVPLPMLLPWRSSPMKLPSTTSSVAVLRIEMPAEVLKPMVFAELKSVPPIVLFSADSTTTPTPLARLASALLVPMKLPSTRLFVDPVEIDTPALVLPPITFPEPEAVPPIVLPNASRITPMLLDSMSFPSRTLPDAPAPEIETSAAVLPTITFPALRPRCRRSCCPRRRRSRRCRCPDLRGCRWCCRARHSPRPRSTHPLRCWR